MLRQGLLDQIDEDIDRFVADGIYDQEPVYTAVEKHSPGARVIIQAAQGCGSYGKHRRAHLSLPCNDYPLRRVRAVCYGCPSGA